MTQKQIAARLTYWQKHMRLTHWKINLIFDEDLHDSAVASVSLADDYDRCHMQIDMEKIKDDPNINLDHIIVHELLHLQFRDLDQSYGLMREYVSPGVWNMYQEQMEHEIEGIVDRLAAIISKN